MNTAILLWGLVFSSIGLGYATYGRRQNKKLVFYSGLGLIIYPYFVGDLKFLIVIGFGLLLAPFLASKLFN